MVRLRREKVRRAGGREGEGGEEYSRSSSVSSFITVSVSQSLHYSFVLEPPSLPSSPPHTPPANAPVLGSVLMSNPTKQSHIIHWKKKKSFWQTLGGRFLQVWTCGKTLDVT